MFTEFDEQETSQTMAKWNLIEKYHQFIIGDETMGVLQGYENAARNIGVSEAEINACYV